MMMTTQEDDSLPPGGLHSLPPRFIALAAWLEWLRGGGEWPPRWGRGAGAGLTRAARVVIGGRGARALGLLCGRGGRGYGRVGADVTTTVTSWASGDVAGGPTCVGEREVRRGGSCLAAFLRHHKASPALRRRAARPARSPRRCTLRVQLFWLFHYFHYLLLLLLFWGADFYRYCSGLLWRKGRQWKSIMQTICQDEIQRYLVFTISFSFDFQ